MRTHKSIISIACAVFLCGTLLLAAEPTPKESAANEVPGLKLPSPITINYDEMYVDIVADTKGEVKWLILVSNKDLKYKNKINPNNPNQITIGVPPQKCIISLYAIAIVDNKLTEYARTDIIVNGPSPIDPTPPPQPTPTPNNLSKPLHLSVVHEPGNISEATKSIIDDPKLRTRLSSKQITMRVFSTANTAELKQLRFDSVISTYGIPLMILQDNKGNSIIIQKLPNSQAELLQLLKPIVGDI